MRVAQPACPPSPASASDHGRLERHRRGGGRRVRAELALVARSRAGLETVAARVRGFGGATFVIPADVGDRAQVESAVAGAVGALCGLDVLVLNAAAMSYGRFAESRAEDFDRTWEVTFRGAVDTVRAALPHLERSGGAIVATGSVVAKLPLPAFSGYTASKHALRGFLGSLRIELLEQRSPVTVSIVHPGPVDTPLWAKLTSATGRQPRNPPDLYSPQAIAKALVAVTVRPRVELTVGLEMRALEILHHHARPLADIVLVLGARYYASGHEPGGLAGGAVGAHR